MPRAVGHLQMIGPQASGHVGNPYHPARLERNEALAHQIEIGDAIDFFIIGDAAVAIAEADLRPHIDFYFVPAELGGATERAPGGPTIAWKRPGDFLPALDLRAGMLIAGDAGQRADRSRKHDQQHAAHLASPRYGRPATARAAPLSSRICRPVLARSTM